MADPNTKFLFEPITKKRESAPHSLSRVLYAVVLAKPYVEEGNRVRNLLAGIRGKDPVGGRLIDHVSFGLVIVEGPEETVNNHMAGLRNEVGQKVEAAKIVASTSDNPDQIFPDWREFEQMEWPVVPQPASLQPFEESNTAWQKYSGLLAHANSDKIERDIKLTSDDALFFMSGRFMTVQEYSEFYLEQPMHEFHFEKDYPQPHSLVKMIEYKETRELSFI